MTRILVIDDDTQFRQMLCRMLHRQGYDVYEASNGKEGIERYRRNPTDVVITDIIMPEKEGLETIIELKQDYPEVNIIAVSGGSRCIDTKNCLASARAFGVSHQFGKPLDRIRLLEAIEELCHGSTVH